MVVWAEMVEMEGQLGEAVRVQMVMEQMEVWEVLEVMHMLVEHLEVKLVQLLQIFIQWELRLVQDPMVHLVAPEVRRVLEVREVHLVVLEHQDHQHKNM